MTRIDIISGFLGAGKTTLIKKLLGDALKGQQVVLCLSTSLRQSLSRLSFSIKITRLLY